MQSDQEKTKNNAPQLMSKDEMREKIKASLSAGNSPAKGPGNSARSQPSQDVDALVREVSARKQESARRKEAASEKKPESVPPKEAAPPRKEAAAQEKTAVTAPKPESTPQKQPSMPRRGEAASPKTEASAPKKETELQKKEAPAAEPAEETMEEKMRRIKEAMSAKRAEFEETVHEKKPKKQNTFEENRDADTEKPAVKKTEPHDVKNTPVYREYPTEKRSPRNPVYREKPAAMHTAVPEAEKSRDGLFVGRSAKVILTVCIVILIAIAAVYFGGLIRYRGKFLPHTFVNGMDISGMTESEAEDAILKTAQEQSITFVTKSGEQIVFQGSSYGCTATLPNGALEDAASENLGLWFVKIFRQSDYEVQLNEFYSETNLASLIAAYDWGDVAPTDAEIVKDADGTFSIQPEDDGNLVDVQKLSDYALSEMRFGNHIITMEDSGCYAKASVRSEDLEETLAIYQKIGQIEITYSMEDRQENIDPTGTETISNATLMDWIDTDSGDLTLDKAKATDWIQRHIADPYDTFVTGYSRTFQSTLDGTIELPIGSTGTYGWKTDVEATVSKLEEHIKEGKPITIEPVYKVEGFRKGDDSGNTYIEVDICHQKLFYYVNGELYVETDCVTGMATDPSRVTPPGAFKVWSKESPRVLGTMEVQGYETLVQYWMPIDYTGIGLHDLNRSAYGGTIYQYNGSHGCINLPLSVAAEIYNKVEIGTPVIVVP